MTTSSANKTLLIGKETGWGSGGTANKDCGLLIEEINDTFTREVFSSKSIGSLEDQAINSGVVDAGFNVKGHFQHGRLLELVFGTAAHVQSTSDWAHTFTITDPASIKAESSENSSSDTVLTHTGMLVDSAELSIELNGVLSLSVDFKGKSTTSSTSAAAATISSLQVFPHAQCAVKLDGTEATEVQNASVTVTKTVELAGGIGSNIYQQGHPTECSFEFTATLGFTDETYQEFFLGGTTPSASSNPTGFLFEISSDNAVSLGSGKRGVQLILKECIANNFEKNTSVPGLIFITIGGIGRFGTAVSWDNISSSSW